MRKKISVFCRKASRRCGCYLDFLERTYSDYKAFVEKNEEIALKDSPKHCFIKTIDKFDIFFSFKSAIYLLDPLTDERENLFMLDIDFVEIEKYLFHRMKCSSSCDQNYITKLLARPSFFIKEFLKYISKYCVRNNINYLFSQTDSGFHLYIVDFSDSSGENIHFLKKFQKLKTDEERLNFLVDNKLMKLFYELFCDPSCACNLLPHYRKVDGKNRLVSKYLYAVRASQKLFLPFEKKGYSTKFARTADICSSIVEKELSTNLNKSDELLEFYNYIKHSLFRSIEEIKQRNISILINEKTKYDYKKVIKDLKLNYNRKDFNKKEQIVLLKNFLEK